MSVEAGLLEKIFCIATGHMYSSDSKNIFDSS